jgi:hypothetical protein
MAPWNCVSSEEDLKASGREVPERVLRSRAGV